MLDGVWWVEKKQRNDPTCQVAIGGSSAAKRPERLLFGKTPVRELICSMVPAAVSSHSKAARLKGSFSAPYPITWTRGAGSMLMPSPGLDRLGLS